MKILFFDVETPNNRNDKISQLGLVLDIDGKTVFERNYLINPETHFDDFNMELTSVTPALVKDSQTFPNIWNEIRDYFSSSLLVAHNATFDLSVLDKTLSAYKIDAPASQFLCTYKKAKKSLHSENYKLNTLCSFFDIPLDEHHNAICDAKACRDLFYKLDELYGWEECDISTKFFGESDLSTKSINNNIVYSASTKGMQDLKLLIENIKSDGNIDDDELVKLSHWMEEHEELIGIFPFDKIFNTLSAVLYDKTITDEERQLINSLFNTFINPFSDVSFNNSAIDFSGKKVCLTGTFETGSKKQIGEHIISLGGIITKNLTKSTDILLVGGQGSTAWAYGNYGNKIKDALQWQEDGIAISIIGEKEVFN